MVRRLIHDLFPVVSGGNVEAVRIGVSAQPPFVFAVIFVRDLDRLVDELRVTSLADDSDIEDVLSAMVTVWARRRLQALRRARLVVRVHHQRNANTGNARHQANTVHYLVHDVHCEHAEPEFQRLRPRRRSQRR